MSGKPKGQAANAGWAEVFAALEPRVFHSRTPRGVTETDLVAGLAKLPPSNPRTVLYVIQEETRAQVVEKIRRAVVAAGGSETRPARTWALDNGVTLALPPPPEGLPGSGDSLRTATYAHALKPASWEPPTYAVELRSHEAVVNAFRQAVAARVKPD